MKRDFVIFSLLGILGFGLLAQNHQRVKAADLSGLQGRYALTECQFQFTDENGNDGRAIAPFLVDTVTGHVWMYSGSNAKTLTRAGKGWRFCSASLFLSSSVTTARHR